MAFYEDEILPVKTAIQDYFYGNEFQKLVSMYQTSDFMKRYYDKLVKFCVGGKCIRGYLTNLGYRLTQRKDCLIAVPALASYEAFEAGILGHDDIIDRSPLRRGIPSMYRALGSRHLGISRAICLSDVGILLANALLEASDFDDQTKLKAIKHQNIVYQKTISGELMDIDLSSSQKYTKEQVIDMIVAKTSWYTIIGPLILGATLANASDSLKRQLIKIGEEAGIAFQIKDDILGLFGTEGTIGKSVYADAQEGKKSIITFYLNEYGSSVDRERFNAIYGSRKINSNEMKEIQAILIDCGALDFAKKEADKHERNARECILHDLETSEHMKDILIAFCDYLVRREK